MISDKTDLMNRITNEMGRFYNLAEALIALAMGTESSKPIERS
jgi:hypothetical protein